jgi:hypothetical protein
LKLFAVKVLKEFAKVRRLWHASRNEESENLSVRKARLEHATGSDKMGSCGNDVVK